MREAQIVHRSTYLRFVYPDQQDVETYLREARETWAKRRAALGCVGE